MIDTNIKYGYNDLSIVPEIISTIDSRNECNPFEGETLPLFTAPMSTITNEHNILNWKNNGIIPIIPRNIHFDYRLQKITTGEWVALSLNEFKNIFINDKEMYKNFEGNKIKVCVDLANGHMKSLYTAINKAKKIAKENKYELIVMTGNIANPETYKWICENSDVDYIRVSIGSGFNCITSTQTSVHYPIASLIDECYKIKKKLKNNSRCPKIIADGGVRGYSDVIKALALGADYVMIGSLFTGLLESAAPLNIECYNSHYKYSFHNGVINNGVEDIFYLWDDKFNVLKYFNVIDDTSVSEAYKREFIKDMKEITKESYGMSTKKAQKLINPNAKMKTSEGCTKYIKVKETIAQWTGNMIDYMKSAMSYTGKRTLSEFRGNVTLTVNSGCAVYSINK